MLALSYADLATGACIFALMAPFLRSGLHFLRCQDLFDSFTKMMEVLIAAGAQHPNGAPLTFDPSNPQTNRIRAA